MTDLPYFSPEVEDQRKRSLRRLVNPDLYAHGVYARYVSGCRCSECRAANARAYHERRARSAALAESVPAGDGRECPGLPGRPCPHRTRLRSDSRHICRRCFAHLGWNGVVDAEPARLHMAHLARFGIGYKSIADAASMSRATAFRIATGKQIRLRKSVLDRILALDEGAVSDCSLVPAEEVWRMLHALKSEYFTWTAVAKALGYKSGRLQFRRDRVTARTAHRVKRLYKRAIGDHQG